MKFWVCMVVLVTSGIMAAERPVFDVWPEGKIPGKCVVGLETNKTPGQSVIRLDNVSRPTLTFYSVPGKTGIPAVIIAPGGGYSILAWDLEGTEIAEWLNSIGVSAFVLKYRVPNNRAGAFMDMQRAVRLVRSRAGMWGVDPNKVGVLGFSAGGHLITRVCTGYEEKVYDRVDAVDDESCRPDFAIPVYPAWLNKGDDVAPEFKIHKGIPPTFLVHCEDDKHYVKGGKVYIAALQAIGVPCEFAYFTEGGHGYGVRSKKAVRVWPERCREWLVKMKIID